MLKLLKYSLYNILRTRFALLYTLFLLMATLGIYSLDYDLSRVGLSLLNVVLLVVPLVCIIFATVHFYNSYEFMELMLAQPINRMTVFLSQILAVGLSLCLAFLIGAGLPMLIYGADSSLFYLLLVGVLLSLVFTGLAFLASVMTRDKARAIGITLLFWVYFSLIYDGLVIYLIYVFYDYPLEGATLAMVMLNPVDLARVIMLMQMDVSALMGFTGAFFQSFFGSAQGLLVSFSVLLIWILLPVWAAARVFKKKDL
ncbi:MAG: ABC transporter permease [Saprospirales bacterium]|nr:MAG: ABC transporter permease [Saprospirales bacterium]